MGEDKKLDACVKKTQDALGKYLKKPPLTEKLLKKPPFRFLHDIITSVIKQYGLMQGLFTPAEMVSDNVKEKDAKIIFLQKVVDTMILISKENLSVKPSKIVAGQEPEKTNELLQAIAKALERKLDSTSAVQEVLGNNTHDRGSNGKKSKATMQAVNGHSSKKDEKLTRTRPRRSDSKDSQDSPDRPKEYENV
ncbi:TRAF3-interacting protein 1 [Neocloeon triangulifer]|uniref:TRAF3-interacting protein 1 n=1 Tax=Neocloeon triangulifer TaxID=2078957 RepID=UPI00286F7423|nr:TRAF3-interacting protein 1 [Neocloeon triangulifer]